MSEKDETGEPSSAQEIISPTSPTIGKLISSDPPPTSTMFLIDTDDEDVEGETPQIESRDELSDGDDRSDGDLDEPGCDKCKNMESSTKKAYASLLQMKKQMEKHNHLEKENQQLRSINGENAKYVQELLVSQKKIEAKNIELEAELTQEKKQGEARDAQIKTAYERIQESQTHLNAANEWRAKYILSQETLKQVHEMRKSYDEKMADSLKVAQDLSVQLDKSERKAIRLTDEATGIRSRLKYISDYMPVLLSAIDLLIKKFPDDPDIHRTYKKFTEPDVRLVLMGKRISNKSLDELAASKETEESVGMAELNILAEKIDLASSACHADLENVLKDLTMVSRNSRRRAVKKEPSIALSPKEAGPSSEPSDQLMENMENPSEHITMRPFNERKREVKPRVPTLQSKTRSSPRKQQYKKTTYSYNSLNELHDASKKTVFPDESSQESNLEYIQQENELDNLQQTELLSPETSLHHDLRLSESEDDDHDTSEFTTDSPIKTAKKSPLKAVSTQKNRAVGFKSPQKISRNKVFNTPSTISTKPLEDINVPAANNELTRSIHGRKTVTIRQQQEKMGSISDRIAKLKEDPTFVKSTISSNEITKDEKNNFTIIPRDTTNKKKLEDLLEESETHLIENVSDTRPTTLGDTAVQKEKRFEPKNLPYSPAKRIARTKQLISKGENLFVEESIEGVKNDLGPSQPTKIQDAAETSDHQIAPEFEETSLNDDLRISESEDEEEAIPLRIDDESTIVKMSPRKASPTKKNIGTAIDETTNNKDEMTDLVDLQSAESITESSSNTQVDEPSTKVQLIRPVQKRKATVRQQIANMRKISDQIAKIKEDSTFEKPKKTAQETAKEDKNNFSIVRRSSPSKKKLEDSVQNVETPTAKNVRDKEPAVSTDMNPAKYKDLRISPEKRIARLGSKNVTNLMKTENASALKTVATDATSTQKSSNEESLSVKELNKTSKAKQNLKMKAQKDDIITNSSNPEKISMDIASKQTMVIQPAKKISRAKQQILDDVLKTENTLAGNPRKRKTTCFDALPLDAPIANKRQYTSTPGSVASQIEDLFKKIASGVPLRKASSVLSMDLDEVSKLLGPITITNIFIDVLNITEVGNLWISLTKPLTAYRRTKHIDPHIAFQHTTAKVELEFLEVINQMDFDGELFDESFKRICTLIFSQKEPTMAQFCRNVRLAFLLLHYDKVLSHQEKLTRSRRLVEFMLYERDPDLALSALSFICFNDAQALLDWFDHDDTSAVKLQICALLTERTTKKRDYIDLLSIKFPDAGFSPLDSESMSKRWAEGLKCLDNVVSNLSMPLNFVNGEIRVDEHIVSEIEKLVIIYNNAQRLKALGVLKNLIDEAFAMIDQWIFGETTSTTTSFLSDLTKMTSSINKTKLSCVGVHLTLAITMIAEYVGRETMAEIFGLMEILKYYEEKLPVLLSRCSHSKMPSDCITLTMDILQHWEQTTKQFTEYPARV